MRPALLWVLAAGAAGCHAHSAQDVAAPDEGAKAEAEADAGVKPARKAPAPSAAANTTGSSARPESERAPAAPGRPQLASSPEGMMLPEGAGLIQQALAGLGYLADHHTGTLDAETSGALRRFQADQKVARTGAPDRETLRLLGLSPDKVFRQPGS